ncbi:hypothetical protein E2C01_009959 [Portunus trituberculatus]|uniref:Uncharacterized protein n=1 Tax=Portunus trituberculatus TaxID=210409 RepID=A0A5B7D739_PORTR|nr:hypothetical protein [Portunus trituberculatus]
MFLSHIHATHAYGRLTTSVSSSSAGIWSTISRLPCSSSTRIIWPLCGEARQAGHTSKAAGLCKAHQKIRKPYDTKEKSEQVNDFKLRLHLETHRKGGSRNEGTKALDGSRSLDTSNDPSTLLKESTTKPCVPSRFGRR